jgi:glycosyl transferase family 25
MKDLTFLRWPIAAKVCADRKRLKSFNASIVKSIVKETMDTKVYILHCATLAERKEHMLQQMKRAQMINFEWIENFDKDEITDEQASKFKADYKRSTMSLHLKWNHVFDLIAVGLDPYVLVLEDDVIFREDFSACFDTYMKQLPDDFDMFFLGDGCRLHYRDTVPGKNVYLHASTRCTDSIVISKKCAEKLSRYISQPDLIIDTAIDHWLTPVMKQLDLKVYWAEPTIITQGSQNGLFHTSH